MGGIEKQHRWSATVLKAQAADGVRSGRLSALWSGVVAAGGVLFGLLPHVLHHVALLAGTALVAGSGGTALFGAIGLVASIPMLVRLHSRFGTWFAPAIGLALFVLMFLLSAFVIGPATSGVGGIQWPQFSSGHSSHHG